MMKNRRKADFCIVGNNSTMWVSSIFVSCRMKGGYGFGFCEFTDMEGG